jgi:hypothetical protein
MYGTAITLEFYGILVVVNYSHKFDAKDLVFDQKTHSPVWRVFVMHI